MLDFSEQLLFGDKLSEASDYQQGNWTYKLSAHHDGHSEPC